MQAFPIPITPVASRTRTRTALVTSADRSFRNRLTEALTGLRWQVREAEGGAEAWAAAELGQLEAIIVDSWLPDLDLSEFLHDFGQSFPHVDVLTTGSAPSAEMQDGARSPYRQELLYALRRCQDTDSAAWNTAPSLTRSLAPAAGNVIPAHGAAGVPSPASSVLIRAAEGTSFFAASEELLTDRTLLAPLAQAQSATEQATDQVSSQGSNQVASHVANQGSNPSSSQVSNLVANQAPQRMIADEARTVVLSEAGIDGSLLSGSVFQSAKSAAALNSVPNRTVALSDRLPELIGNSQLMLEVSRRIRLVAPRITPVLIEGPTGSGKELVAEGLHRLSNRSRKPFVAINCAAIPEALLEAELFGHTRGAFTGAVQGRVGRIEAAEGGTLFLDEIGEMPLALQSKLLRFVESGVLQKVGDNETVKVDVRIIAATHQPLAEHAQSGSFRADLYYRLAVFLIRTPSLREHIEDLPLLVGHFLEQMGREAPIKRIDESAIARLQAHDWPGNVRELEHVLERAEILAGEETTITAHEIDFGLSVA